MKLIPAVAGLSFPSFLKKIGLNSLSRATASAFGCPAPHLKARSYQESLRKYALFTREEAIKVARCPLELTATQDHLYGRGYRWGKRLRQLLHVTTLEEAMALGQILYRTLEIDFEGNSQGEITIRRCFFSDFYPVEVCKVISALDRGVIEGLAGAGQLEFYQRLTEGAECCKACLKVKE